MSDALRSDNLKADQTVSRAFDRPAMLRLACHVQGAATAEVAIYVHRPRRACPSTLHAVMPARARAPTERACQCQAASAQAPAACAPSGEATWNLRPSPPTSPTGASGPLTGPDRHGRGRGAKLEDRRKGARPNGKQARSKEANEGRTERPSLMHGAKSAIQVAFVLATFGRCRPILGVLLWSCHLLEDSDGLGNGILDRRTERLDHADDVEHDLQAAHRNRDGRRKRCEPKPTEAMRRSACEE